MTTPSAADARASFSKLVESTSKTHQRCEEMRNGTRAAVLVGADDHDALIETVEVLSDPDAVRAVRDALADFDCGRFVTEDAMRERLRTVGRIRERTTAPSVLDRIDGRALLIDVVSITRRRDACR
ncbi:MAG: type II toxin-antitoxin system Phd/YefM family antitoxin [Curtobacterium sp.]